jgi:hypothetical protein
MKKMNQFIKNIVNTFSLKVFFISKIMLQFFKNIYKYFMSLSLAQIILFSVAKFIFLYV